MSSPISTLKNKSRFLILLALSLTACAIHNPTMVPQTPEVRPGVLAGYLEASEVPNSRELLPPPPSQGPSAYEREVAQVQLGLRDTRRWHLATLDADLSFPTAAGTFSCALGTEISEQNTPFLYTLLRRSLRDAGIATYGAKTLYQRPRPFMVNGAPTCTPEIEERLRGDGSYPSGHTAIGWAWALILAEIDPQNQNAILQRGYAFGESRSVCNVHWHEDVSQGRHMGAAAVARLHANETFLADLAQARRELQTARAKGLTPIRDCELEAAAMAQGRQ